MVASVTFMGMIVISKDAIQNNIGTRCSWRQLQVGLVCFGSPVFSASPFNFTDVKRFGLGSLSLYYLSKLISPSIFFSQPLFPLSFQQQIFSLLHLILPSKEKRNHKRWCFERTQARMEMRHLFYLMLESTVPGESPMPFPTEQVQMPLVRAPSVIHWIQSRSQNSSESYKDSPN